MRLDLTQLRGDTTRTTLTANGEVVADLISDPANDTKPVPVADKVNDTGGMAPLEPAKDGRVRLGRLREPE